MKLELNALAISCC